MRKRQRLLMSGLAILAVLVLAGLVILRTSSAAVKQAEPVPTSMPALTHLDQLRAALESEMLSEPGRLSLEEKLTMEERMAAEQEAGAQAARKEKVAPPLPATAMEVLVEPIQEGIFDGSQGLVRPSLANINNAWQGERQGVLLQVFAGALPDNPKQGIILIYQYSTESMARAMEVLYAPEESGSLRIIEAQERGLLLSAEDGSRLILNLETLSFQD